MPKQSAQLDRIFHALADPTRRAVVERLGNGPAAMTELAEPFNMALPSLFQHLNVLEECGLIDSKKEGRVRTYRLAPKKLEAAEHWMEKQRAVWEQRFDALEAFLNKEKKNEHHRK